MNYNEELQDSLEELSQLTISGQFNEYVLKSLRATLDITYKFSSASTSNILKADHFTLEAL